MLCFFCDKAARGICHYCGRAICYKHIYKGPENLTRNVERASFFEENGLLTQAIWCGQCVNDDIVPFVEKKMQKSSNTSMKEMFSTSSSYIENKKLHFTDMNVPQSNKTNEATEGNPNIKIESCPRCKKNVSDQDSFCPFCGYELATADNKILATCPNCGYYDLSLLEEVFCPKCNAPLPL